MSAISLQLENVDFSFTSASGGGGVSISKVADFEGGSKMVTLDLSNYTGKLTLRVLKVASVSPKRAREGGVDSDHVAKKVLSTNPTIPSNLSISPQPENLFYCGQPSQSKSNQSNSQLTTLLPTFTTASGTATAPLNEDDDDDDDDDDDNQCLSNVSNIINTEATAALVNSPGKPSPSNNKSNYQRSAPPQKRWAHTATLVEETKLLCYGGQTQDGTVLNDIAIYDLEDRQWSRPVNCAGVPRCWHTSTFLPETNSLFVFGGTTSSADKLVVCDAVMVLAYDIMLWYPQATNGTVPAGRSGHSASLVGSNIVLFGGVKRNNKSLNSVAVLDTEIWAWSHLKPNGTPPKPCSYHSATVIGHQIVVFGGNDETECFNSVHVLSLLDSGKLSWFNPQTSGEGPCPRTGHTAEVCEDGSILVYGGWDPNIGDEDEETIFSDSFRLDLATYSWRKGGGSKFVGGSTNSGPKRTGHSMTRVPGGGDNACDLLIWGGNTGEREMSNDFQQI